MMTTKLEFIIEEALINLFNLEFILASITDKEVKNDKEFRKYLKEEIEIVLDSLKDLYDAFFKEKKSKKLKPVPPRKKCKSLKALDNFRKAKIKIKVKGKKNGKKKKAIAKI